VLSNLTLNWETLNKVLDGKVIQKEECYEIFELSQVDPEQLFKTANILRNNNHKNIVTFSKKGFF